MNKTKKTSSVIEDLAGQEEDAYKRATFSLKESDLKALSTFVQDANKQGMAFNVTKSHVIRSALNLLYKQKQPFKKLI